VRRETCNSGLLALVMCPAMVHGWVSTVTAGKWVAKTPMPAPAGQAAVITGQDGRIYLFGGWNSNPPTITDTSKVQIYDPANDVWSMGADIPCSSVGDSAMVSSTGMIHLLNAYEKRIYLYAPASDTWLLPSPAPWMAYAARAVTTTDARSFVFGGERPDALTYEYFPDTFHTHPIRANRPFASPVCMSKVIMRFT